MKHKHEGDSTSFSGSVDRSDALAEFSRAMRKTVADKDRQGWTTHTVRMPTEKWLELCDAIDAAIGGGG